MPFAPGYDVIAARLPGAVWDEEHVFLPMLPDRMLLSVLHTQRALML